MSLWWILVIILLVAYYFYKKSYYKRDTKQHKIFEYIPYGIDDFASLKSQQDVILVVSGNPGIPGFYKYFAKEINTRFSKPVLICGLGGHSLTAPWWSPLSLEGQVEYFQALIGEIKTISPNIRISLVGHSIGSYFCLQMTKFFRFEKVYLLFPTISNMAKSDNGKQLFYHIVVWLRYLVNVAFFLCEFLPLSLMDAVIHYLEVMEPSVHDLHDMLIPQLIQARLLNNVFYLLKHELAEVLEMDHTLIEKNIGILHFYYAKHDPWVPSDVPTIMKEKYGSRVDIDLNGVKHAFVTRKRDTDIVLDYLKL
jgi:hypothetical protein